MRSVVELLLSGCVLPTLLTVALFRTGRTSTLDLRDRADRLLPATVTASGCAAAWALLCATAAPYNMCALAVGVCAQMALLALLTTRWKVSYHAASACALVAVSRPMDNASLTLVLALLAFAIGWARVYQRRHTVAQVAVGALTTVPLLLSQP